MDTTLTADEEGVHLRFNIVVNRQDNRTIGMLAENIEKVQTETHIGAKEHKSKQKQQQQQPGAASAPVSAPNDAEQPTVTTSFPPADNTAIPCKSMFEQLLDHEGRSSELMSKGYYDEAYGILDGMFELDEELLDLPFLCNYYQTLLVTGRSEEAEETYDKMISLIRDKLQVSPDNAMKFAKKMYKGNRHLLAITLNRIAADLHFSSPKSSVSALGILKCIDRTRDAALDLIVCGSEYRACLEFGILPIMHDMKTKLLRCTEHCADKVLFHTRYSCFHIIECTELEIEDYESREQTLKDALEVMKAMYGESASHYQMYGTYLNNLGATYMATARYEEATDCYAQAIQAFHEAEDFENVEKKIKYIGDAEVALSAALRRN